MSILESQKVNSNDDVPVNEDDTSLISFLVSVSISVGKFIYGYIFGLLIWSIVVVPYLSYYDFTYGSHGPMSIFATLVGLTFMTSLWVRSLLVLYLPSMVGGNTQNYVVMLIISALLMNPVTNIGLNAIESVRVIGCSLTMTFDQLRERAKLVLNPIAEVLSDKKQTDLDPIRKNLFEIQRFVGKLQKNIDFTTSRLNGTDGNYEKNPEIAANKEAVVAGEETTRTSSTRSKSSESQGSIQDQVSLEWDLENFGIKASVDVDHLRALAKSGHLKKFLMKGNETLSGPVNMTDILYNSCVEMFRLAKKRCSDAVTDMHESCRLQMGPLLSAWWCEPFTYSLDKFCPTIMNQLVNENNVCKELRLAEIGALSKGRKFIDSHQLDGGNGSIRYKDLNEAFSTLTRHVGNLNENILSMDDEEGKGADKDHPASGGGGSSNNGTQSSLVSSPGRLRRFELSLTFNEQTRRIFQDIKQLIEFISDKYKWRRLIIDLSLLLYDMYTTYTFALILIQAWRYRKNYLTNNKFDNCYITREFIELDLERGRENTKLPASKSTSLSSKTKDDENVAVAIDTNTEAQKKSGQGSSVLPLTKDESRRYMSPFTCCQRTKEERRLLRASIWSLAVLLVISLSILYLDNIFYSILDSIQEHSLIRYKEVGHHELDIKVYGDGMIARLVRRLVGSFSSAYKLDRQTTTQKCLPQASHTTLYFYLNFLALVSIYFLIDQFSIYAKRLRPVTCSLFYPDRERSRIEYLHRYIRSQRRKLAKIGVKNYLASEDGSLASESDKKLLEDLEDIEEEAGAYSLGEAAEYLGQCLVRSSREYCSCWQQFFFAPGPKQEDSAHKLVPGTP